jgi:CRISPR-associated endonuclease/helicase Cas3
MGKKMSSAENSQVQGNAKYLWAKSTPFKNLWHHMLDSGYCAANLVEQRLFAHVITLISEALELPNCDTKRIIIYLAAMHDCHGKAHPAFQCKVQELSLPFREIIGINDRCSTFRHEKFGEKAIMKELLDAGVPMLPARVLASAIGIHHQKSSGDSRNERRGAEQWQAMRDDLSQAAQAVFQPPLDKLHTCTHCDAAVMSLAALVILADWIASSEPFAMLDAPDEQAYRKLSQETAKQTVEAYGLASGDVFPAIEQYNAIWSFLNEDTLRPLQRVILSQCEPEAGLTIIEAPMGEGKTEAAAFYAARLCGRTNRQGIYFALPTAATSNQMYQRINTMLAAIGRGEARLMHGMAWLMAETMPNTSTAEDRDEVNAWLRPMRRAMLAESAVGTVDQAMMAAMPVRFGCLRLLGLTGKVLVVDEVHAYDAYMGTIIERLLMWCHALGIQVVLLSATLTLEKRRHLLKAYGGKPDTLSMAYPLLTQVSGDRVTQHDVAGSTMRNRYRFVLRKGLGDAPEIARIALERVREGGCLCVLLNTVREAQEAYQAMQGLARSDTTVLLYHARFKAKKRDELEQTCMRLFGKDSTQRPMCAILVCTQVVEQSLDVDFDGILTAIAPIDLLLQRAGRVHRHAGRVRPAAMQQAFIEVLVPPEGGQYGASAYVYAPWLLKQTHEYLPRDIQVPEDIRQAVETVYQTPEDIPDDWARMMFEEQGKNAQAKGNMLPEPDAERFFGWDDLQTPFSLEDGEERGSIVAHTRMSEPNQRIALLPADRVKKLTAEPLNTALAKEALLSSFTVAASAPAMLTGNLTEGKGLLTGTILACDDGQPIRLGNLSIRYEEALGAITERV